METVREQYPDISIADVQSVTKAISISEADKTYIRGIATTASENGADEDVVQQIISARTPEEAILLAGVHLQDPTVKLKFESLRLGNILAKAQINKAEYELSLLKEYGGLSPIEYKKALKEEQAEIEKTKTDEEKTRLQAVALDKKITLLDMVLDSSAIDSVVGPSAFSRAATGPLGFTGRLVAGGLAGGAVGAGAGAFAGGVGAIPGAIGGALIGGFGTALQGSVDYFTGDADRLVGQVEQFISKEFLENLIAVKAQGATFGALQKTEQDALTAAATFIGQRKIYTGKGDDKQVVGYDMSESDFKKELETIQDLTRKAYERATGKAFTSDEQKLLDGAFNNSAVPLPGTSFYE